MRDMDQLVDNQVKTLPSSWAMVCNHTADCMETLGTLLTVIPIYHYWTVKVLDVEGIPAEYTSVGMRVKC